MILNMDWSDFPHLSQHHRELAEHMAQGPGEQALVNAQLEQLRRLCSDSVETRPSQQKVSNPKGGAKKQRARRTGLAPAQDGSGNAGAQ
ncbi:unnamed protein product [Peronospora effusa]|nr:unnamed protein product [Peronospora effusa]